MRSFQEFESQRRGRLSVRCAGAGTPLVLVHGFPEDGDLWRHAAPDLAESHAVWVPDLPGAGDSPRLSQTLTVEAMADALAEALPDPAQKIVLAGHSMGGYVALAFAERYPDRIAGLALVHSTATADGDEKREQRRKSAALLRQDGGRERFLKGAVENLFAPAFRAAHPDLLAAQQQHALTQDGESLAQFTEAMAARPDRKHVLKEARFPVQWIIGEQDQVLPLDPGLEQATLAPVSFLALYTGCGHLSPLEAPHRLAADLARFAAYADFGLNS